MGTMYVFIEGVDDERFFEWYFKEECKFISYSKTKYDKIDKFIKSINSIPNADYIIIADGDGKTIEDKKKDIHGDFPSADINKIYIVQYEIESWYLAGITPEGIVKFKIKPIRETNNITKEKFDSIIPRRFSRVDYMKELLKIYNIEEARSRNITFKNFNDCFAR